MSIECTVRQKPELHNPSASLDTYASFLWELLINLLAALIFFIHSPELSQNLVHKLIAICSYTPTQISLVSELVPFPRAWPKKNSHLFLGNWQKTIPSASMQSYTVSPPKASRPSWVYQMDVFAFMTYSSGEANTHDSNL